MTVTQNAQASSANQQTRTYAYDAMSRLTSEKNPEAAQVPVTYTYDTISSGNCASTSYGDLLKRVDAIGNVTCYTYDLLHRILSQTYSVTSPTVATPGKYFVYDTATVNSTSMLNAKTRLAEAYTCVSPCNSKITDLGLSYSARGEITDVYELTPHSGSTGAPYNLTSAQFWTSGALNQLVGPGIPTITYGADGEGRPTTASDGSSHAPVTSTTYNLYTAPPQLTVTFGSTDSDVFNFDPYTLRLNKYQFNIGSQAVTGNFSWNANGSLGSLNITDPFSSANTQNCSYVADDLSRISQVNCGTIWGQNITYDPFGNIQKAGISGSGGSTFSPTYQSSPSITNRVSQVGGTNATYDANGNSLNDTFRSYTWDAENRPVTIGSVTLTYDAFGHMVEQSTGSANSEIVYSPLGGKFELMNGNTLTKAFVPLTGGATAVYTSSGLAYYRHTDHLGSSRFASTPSQTLYSDTAYSPFGEPYASSGAIDSSFTNQNQDTLAGIYDFLFREQDPNQARWTSPDPAGLAAVDPTDPQSWNRYAYVSGNPLSNLDPLGLSKGTPPPPDPLIPIYQSSFLSDCMWYACIVTSSNSPGAQVGAFSTNSDPSSITYDPGCTDTNAYSGCSSAATGFNMTSPFYQLNAEFRQAYANYVNEVSASLNPDQAVYQPISGGPTGPTSCVAQGGMICTETGGFIWIFAPPGMLWTLSSANPLTMDFINGFGVSGVRNKTFRVIN